MLYLFSAQRIPPLGVVRIPYRGRVFEFWSNKCFVCKGFGVFQCDDESSAEEVECSGGVTYYVEYVGAPSRSSERVTPRSYLIVILTNINKLMINVRRMLKNN